MPMEIYRRDKVWLSVVRPDVAQEVLWGRLPDNILAPFGLRWGTDKEQDGSMLFLGKLTWAIATFLDSLFTDDGMLVIREICVKKTKRLPRLPALIDAGQHWSWTSDRQLGDPCALRSGSVYWWLTGLAQPEQFKVGITADSLHNNLIDPFGFEREIDLAGPTMVIDIKTGTSEDSQAYKQFIEPTFDFPQLMYAKIASDFNVDRLIFDGSRKAPGRR
jgi:hypothetical protein